MALMAIWTWPIDPPAIATIWPSIYSLLNSAARSILRYSSRVSRGKGCVAIMLFRFYRDAPGSGGELDALVKIGESQAAVDGCEFDCGVRGSVFAQEPASVGLAGVV